MPQFEPKPDAPTTIVSDIGETSGTLGAIVSAMSCPMCFPAVASLGAAMGLGFLEQWEPLFRQTLMPLFAGLVIMANGVGWFSHRKWRFSLFRMTGPVLVLLALYPLFGWDSRNGILYSGLAMMVGFAIWDLYRRFRPKKKS